MGRSVTLVSSRVLTRIRAARVRLRIVPKRTNSTGAARVGGACTCSAAIADY